MTLSVPLKTADLGSVLQTAWPSVMMAQACVALALTAVYRTSGSIPGNVVAFGRFSNGVGPSPNLAHPAGQHSALPSVVTAQKLVPAALVTEAYGPSNRSAG